MEKRLTLFLIALLVLAVFVAGCSETAGQAYQKTVYARQKQAAANLQAAPVEYQALPATQNANLQYAGQTQTYTAQQPTQTANVQYAGQTQTYTTQQPTQTANVQYVGSTATYTTQQQGAVANVAPAPVTATTIPAGSVSANQGYVSPGAYANVGGYGSGTGVANTASNALSPFEGTIVSSVCEDSVTYNCDGVKLVKKTVRTCTQVSQCQQTCSNGACGCTPEKKVMDCQGNVQTIRSVDAQCVVTTSSELCPNNQVCINNACGTPTGQCTPACSNTQTCQNGVCVDRTQQCPASTKVCNTATGKIVVTTYAWNGNSCVPSTYDYACKDANQKDVPCVADKNDCRSY